MVCGWMCMVIEVDAWVVCGWMCMVVEVYAWVVCGWMCMVVEVYMLECCVLVYIDTGVCLGGVNEVHVIGDRFEWCVCMW